MPNEKNQTLRLLSNVGKNQKKTMSKGNGQKDDGNLYLHSHKRKSGVNVTKRWAKTKLSKLGPNEDY